jgi:luciferase family oxidoreductase group 1
VDLSVFDFGLVRASAGAGAGAALRDMIDLAVRTERWGYRRFWMSEHHNLPAVATSSPAVLIGPVAAATSRLRVGAGGVILPNHPPLVVAEQFATLEALFPGRIDLGLGRAPQMDPGTAAALRRTGGASGGDFAEQLAELRGYYLEPSGGGPAVRAVPGVGYRPAMWLLGTGSYSAELAGRLGMPFAFAHHFSPDRTVAALASYRAHFRPSADLARPHAMVAAQVLVAGTDEHSEWLFGPSMVNVLCARRGEMLAALPTPEEAAAFDYTDEERAITRTTLGQQVVGGPDTVRRRLTDLLAATAADEFLAVTVAHDHADRLRSYELLADLAGNPT